MVLAEEPLETEGEGVPPEYKFHCFHGRVHGCQLVDWSTGQRRVVRLGRDGGVRSAPEFFGDVIDGKVGGPIWERMVEVAGRLSAGHRYLRVDLYAVGERVLVGELTVYPASGWGAGTTHNARGIYALAIDGDDPSWPMVRL
jgi:hypothetical protein